MKENIFEFVSLLLTFAVVTVGSSKIIISMDSYDVFNKKGESIESFHRLEPNSVSPIVLTNIPSSVFFIVIQSHSYLVNVTLSYDMKLNLSNSVSGTNSGLMALNKNSELMFYLTYNSSTDPVDVMIAVQGYKYTAPIPGGCNLEFNIEVSPFLNTFYTNNFIQVDFAAAAPPAASTALVNPNRHCNLKLSQVVHEVYYHYSKPDDNTNKTYFKMLRSMMTVGRIKESGIISGEKFESPLRRIFAAYPRRGITFVVVSKYLNETSVYVPSFTYVCDDWNEENQDSCSKETSALQHAVLCSLLAMGLFVCFSGTRFPRIHNFVLPGLVVTGVVSYQALSTVLDPEVNLFVSTSIGCLLAAPLAFYFVNVMATLAPIGVTLSHGFLMASLIFYWTTDLVSLFAFDLNFWAAFIGLMMLWPSLLPLLSGGANKFASSFLGAFMFVYAVDYYTDSSLRYILLNSFRRISDDKFRWALIAPPFQMNEMMLSLCWLFLTVTGVLVQSRLTKVKMESFVGENTPLLYSA